MSENFKEQVSNSSKKSNIKMEKKVLLVNMLTVYLTSTAVNPTKKGAQPLYRKWA